MPDPSWSAAGRPDLATIHVDARGRLRFADLWVPCRLGRSGVVRTKREGDGATPAGVFPLRRVYYRADRVSRPQTSLPVVPLSPALGWCDDPRDPAYNRPVLLPYPARAESLWRDDALYDIVVVLGHNDDPVVPGAGSAIFLHLAPPDDQPTAGCLGLTAAPLRRLLALATPQTLLVVTPPDDETAAAPAASAPPTESLG